MAQHYSARWEASVHIGDRMSQQSIDGLVRDAIASGREELRRLAGKFVRSVEFRHAVMENEQNPEYLQVVVAIRFDGLPTPEMERHMRMTGRSDSEKNTEKLRSLFAASGKKIVN